MSFKLNGIKVNVDIFPDKTSQVWKVSESSFEGKSYNIEWNFESESEVIQLVQLVDLIRHGHIPRPVNLYMPYLPYGRQDKGIDNNATFALKSFCRVLSMLRFDDITTLDAHSTKADEYLWNYKNIHPSKQISQALRMTNATAIAFPDKGASDRYFGRDETIGHHLIIGHKVRDQLTGYITEYNIEGDPNGKDVLIIDDICDGGMTFRLLTKDLLKAGASSVSLYVTHGIFSKGVQILLDDGISRIFTKDGEVFPIKRY